MKTLLSANDGIAKWGCDPEFKAAYDALEEEFALPILRFRARDKDALPQDKKKI